MQGTCQKFRIQEGEMKSHETMEFHSKLLMRHMPLKGVSRGYKRVSCHLVSDHLIWPHNIEESDPSRRNLDIFTLLLPLFPL